MHLMTTCFVAGSVVADVDGVEECAGDVEVVLSREGSEVARTATDMFGDFRFDRLEKDSGPVPSWNSVPIQAAHPRSSNWAKTAFISAR